MQLATQSLEAELSLMSRCPTGENFKSDYLNAIASPSPSPCQWVSQSVIGSMTTGSLIVSDLEIAIASPSFATLFGPLFEIILSDITNHAQGHWVHSCFGFVKHY